MNVLHVIDSAGIYGAEVMLLSLMEEQRKLGINSLLLSIGNESAGQKSIEIKAKIKCLNVIALRFKNGLNIKGALDIISKAKSHNCHIIHSHGYKGNILLGILPRKYRSIPVISTIHGSTSTSVLSKIGVYELIDAFAQKNLDCTVAVSRSISEKRIIKLLHLKPVVINNGVTQREFKKGEFKKIFPVLNSIISGKFKIIAIGRLSKEKGFDILIRSMAHLVPEHDVSLIIMGEGEERAYLENLVNKLRLDKIVHIVGYQQQAYRFLADFDLFVMSSLTEGLPISILEAMQAAIPIVATGVGEIPLILDNGKYGIIVPPNDVNALCDAIKKVIENKCLSYENANVVREYVLKHYSEEKMASEYCNLYREVIINYGSSPS